MESVHKQNVYEYLHITTSICNVKVRNICWRRYSFENIFLSIFLSKIIINITFKFACASSIHTLMEYIHLVEMLMVVRCMLYLLYTCQQRKQLIMETINFKRIFKFSFPQINTRVLMLIYRRVSIHYMCEFYTPYVQRLKEFHKFAHVTDF